MLTVIESLAPASPERHPVVVAAHDLAAGDTVTTGDVTVVGMPAALVPAGSASSASEVVGQVVAGPMRSRAVVTDRSLLGPSLVAGYPRGSVAAPVRIRDAGVVRLLQVGDLIDVYAARDADAAADLVVASAPVVTLPATDDSEQGGLVVLDVSPGQAAALAQAAATSVLSVTLRR